MKLHAFGLISFASVASFALSPPLAAAQAVEAAPVAAARAAAFTGIGDLAGGVYESVAHDVSADGARVVGYSVGAAGKQAIVWESQTGLRRLVGEGAEARAISHAGDVVVGVVTDAEGYRKAVRWVNEAVPEPAPFSRYYGIAHSEAWGVSGDGQLIVGEAVQFGGVPFGFTWSQAQMSLGKPYLNAASSDGSTLVGMSVPERDGFARAMRNRDTLPYPFSDCAGPDCPCQAPGQCEAEATDVSPDGSISVGWAYRRDTGALVAVRWVTDATGSTTSSVFSGSEPAQAQALSADGEVVVGYVERAGRSVATRWVGGEEQAIAALLEEQGIAVPGWSLEVAQATSFDGSVIVGTGVNPDGDVEGWVATLPLAGASGPPID